MMFGKTISTSGLRALRFAASVGLLVSLNSCVPLLIGAAGVTVGYIARDEGVGQAPPLEGSGYRESSTETYEEPVAYGDGSGEIENLDGYDVPVY
tara:strand:- start:39668 stop:39952 length:285 start_codon:yes stop_codon:yes gene_type:complete